MIHRSNPFEDTEEVRTKHSLRPRFRVTGIHPDCVEVEVEMVDDQGRTVITVQRAILGPADSILLSNVVVEMSIKEVP